MIYVRRSTEPKGSTPAFELDASDRLLGHLGEAGRRLGRLRNGPRNRRDGPHGRTSARGDPRDAHAREALGADLNGIAGKTTDRAKLIRAAQKRWPVCPTGLRAQWLSTTTLNSAGDSAFSKHGVSEWNWRPLREGLRWRLASN
jgi:hypothetical protein